MSGAYREVFSGSVTLEHGARIEVSAGVGEYSDTGVATHAVFAVTGAAIHVQTSMTPGNLRALAKDCADAADAMERDQAINGKVRAA